MIETERLFLRTYEPTDFDQFKSLVQDPEIMKHIGREPSTDDDAWLRFLANAGRWQLLGYGLFAVFEKASGAYVGDTGFSDFKRQLGPDFDPYHEAAWLFVREMHGKGYAFEAASAAHDWLDQKFRPTKSVCIINPENSPSIRLAEKLGYFSVGEGLYRGDTVIMFNRLPGG
ncbi:MAG: GNAT family N-acetyltransferase [Parasphingorhabdus sp.]